MSELRHAESFRDLVVYQKAKLIAKRIYDITQVFPREEIYSLTDQVRRSSRSVGAQIAEAWAKRRYENHFVSKLTDADAEQQETQHWIDTAEDCGYIDPSHRENLIRDLEELGRMINGMIGKAHLFCGTQSFLLRDSVSEHLVNRNSFTTENC